MPSVGSVTMGRSRLRSTHSGCQDISTLAGGSGKKVGQYLLDGVASTVAAVAIALQWSIHVEAASRSKNTWWKHNVDPHRT